MVQTERGGLLEFKSPTGCQNFWCGGGGWAGRSVVGVPKGGLVGTPTYILQNYPHDVLITWNIHNWGGKNFKKKKPISPGSHQPRSDPEVRPGVKFFFVFFTQFLILHKVLSIL